MKRRVRSRLSGLPRYAAAPAVALLLVLSLAACGQPRHQRVLLIGDSITTHYFRTVKTALPDWDVGRNPGLARSSDYLLSSLDAWVQPKQWDVIHFNVGIWDMRYMLRNRTCNRAYGKIANQPEAYRANLEAIVTKLESSGALLIFATTTPAPRRNRCLDPTDVPRYNAIALEVMAEHHVIVDDLYTFMLPYADLHKPPTSVHFTDEGYATLGKHVAEEIRMEAARSKGP